MTSSIIFLPLRRLCFYDTTLSKNLARPQVYVVESNNMGRDKRVVFSAPATAANVRRAVRFAEQANGRELTSQNYYANRYGRNAGERGRA